MPNYTEKLLLEQPLQTEHYNVDVQNENMRKIDVFAKEMGIEAESLKKYIDDNSGKEPAGYIQDPGTKVAGNLYRDKITKGLFYCKTNTSINYNSADYFEDYSNYANGNKLQNLCTVVHNIDASYKKWSDGTLECWGKVVLTAGGGTANINFPLQFKVGTIPTVICQGAQIDGNHGYIQIVNKNSTNTKFTARDTSTTPGSVGINWYAVGTWK